MASHGAATPSPAPIYQEHHLRKRYYGRGGGPLPWFLVVIILVVILALLLIVAILAWLIPGRRSAPVPAAAADPQPVVPAEELTASYPPSPSSEAGALNES